MHSCTDDVESGYTYCQRIWQTMEQSLGSRKLDGSAKPTCPKMCWCIMYKPKHRTLFRPIAMPICLAISIVAIWLTYVHMYTPGCLDCQETRSRGCPWMALAGKDKSWKQLIEATGADFVQLLSPENVLRLGHATGIYQLPGALLQYGQAATICPPYPRNSRVQQYEYIQGHVYSGCHAQTPVLSSQKGMLYIL